MDIIDLHPDKVAPEPNTGCWLWTASLDKGGYGQVRHKRKVWRAHRLAFMLAEGYIPPEPSYHHRQHNKALVFDHLCRVRKCVNPDHLQVVTQQENKRRGKASEVGGDRNRANRNRAKTHCPHGHPYSGDNLYVNPKGGRECRTCKRKSRREAMRRSRARRAA